MERSEHLNSDVAQLPLEVPPTPKKGHLRQGQQLLRQLAEIRAQKKAESDGSPPLARAEAPTGYIPIPPEPVNTSDCNDIDKVRQVHHVTKKVAFEEIKYEPERNGLHMNQPAR